VTDIRATVRDYILSEFLSGDDPSLLANDTPLITSGILDSIATVKLVSFLEEEYAVEFEAHEISVDLLNTLDDIARAVESKRNAA
jgi:acyl carrier protein